ncbi:hypothetical protein CYMTET_5660 [Cymbomonas tetramitiformis]|uniref:Uncharacterized protein n=1 Tax=Cymbomonas tetramitiformis TaxID=36881 RepID=A0AAE0GYR2_9CHLO|nr:hypothetical protein CYMTET_5660 [Cymbomonas tetramitiformis]
MHMAANNDNDANPVNSPGTHDNPTYEYDRRNIFDKINNRFAKHKEKHQSELAELMVKIDSIKESLDKEVQKDEEIQSDLDNLRANVHDRFDMINSTHAAHTSKHAQEHEVLNEAFSKLKADAEKTIDDIATKWRLHTEDCANNKNSVDERIMQLEQHHTNTQKLVEKLLAADELQESDDE